MSQSVVGPMMADTRESAQVRHMSSDCCDVNSSSNNSNNSSSSSSSSSNSSSSSSNSSSSSSNGCDSAPITISARVESGFPYRLHALSDDQNRRVVADFGGLPNGLQSVLPWKYKLSGTATLGDLECFHCQQPRAGDVWLCSPPKCGSMWCQELVWLLCHNLDYDSCRRMLTVRWSYRESHLTFDRKHREIFANAQCDNTTAKSVNGAPVTDLNSNIVPASSFIKSHMPFSLLPPALLDTCKTFYVARNPKDICVSFYRHARRYKMVGFNKDFNTFAEHFLDGTVLSTPVIPHMIEAWQLRTHPNLCFLFYEDLKCNLISEIKRVAKFLGKSYSPAEIDTLADYLRIDNFKNNPWRRQDFGKLAGVINEGEGEFIRKGKTGDWRNYMSDHLSARFDVWIEESLKDTDLEFTMDLAYQD